MIKNITIILIIFAMISCNQIHENNEIIGKKIMKFEETKDTINSRITKINKIKSLSEIIEFIDSLYDYPENKIMDTIYDLKENWFIKYKVNIGALDFTNVVEFYNYHPFDFVIFSDNENAKKQFKTIIETADKGIEEFIKQDLFDNLYMQLFTKGGSSYILYDNMIIYYDRMCKFDEKIEIPREDKFLEFLFNNKFPNETYYIRIRCASDKSEKR
jgi:hypothetical protein